VIAAFLPLIEESARAAHEFVEERASFEFMAGAEVEAEAHPVEFEAVKVVAFAVFLDEAEVVVADGGVGEVECAIAPVDRAPGDAAVLGVVAPEGAVHVAGRIVDVVKIVHAHRDPGEQLELACARDPELVGVDVLLGKRPGGVDPLAGVWTGIGGGRAEERLVVGSRRVVTLPDGVPDFAGEAGALGIGGEDQFPDLGIGVLVDESGNGFFSDRLAGAGEEPMAVVFVEGEGSLPGRCGGERRGG
jgi:hypothetical protein